MGGGGGGLAGADTGDGDTAQLGFLPESPGCFAFLGISSLRFELSYCAAVCYRFPYPGAVYLVRCRMFRAVLLCGGGREVVKGEV